MGTFIITNITILSFICGLFNNSVISKIIKKEIGNYDCQSLPNSIDSIIVTLKVQKGGI